MGFNSLSVQHVWICSKFCASIMLLYTMLWVRVKPAKKVNKILGWLACYIITS